MLNKNIARLRKSKGLTQVELSKLLHVTQSAVSHWESGRSIPDTVQLFNIASFFGVTVEELTNGVSPLPAKGATSSPPAGGASPQGEAKGNEEAKGDGEGKELPPPESIPEYLSRLTPENRAFIEEMARKLLASQETK